MTTLAGDSQHRVYRSDSVRRWAIATTVGAVVFCVVAAIPGTAQALWILMAGAAIVCSCYGWTTGIHVDRDGIRVVGIFMWRRILWNDIDHFAVLPLGGYPNVGHVVLRDGRRFGTFGINAPARPKSKAEEFRRQVQEPIDELNELLAQRRGAPDGP